jgi:hypothetical protein
MIFVAESVKDGSFIGFKILGCWVFCIFMMGFLLCVFSTSLFYHRTFVLFFAFVVVDVVVSNSCSVCGVWCCFMWFWPGLVFFVHVLSICSVLHFAVWFWPLTLYVSEDFLFNVFENIYSKC